MSRVPASVIEFLQGRRIVVSGVSRDPRQPANLISQKLRSAGYEVFAVNPNAREIGGRPCYPDLAAVPGGVDGVIAAAHSRVALDLVRQCAERGVGRIWFHQAIGAGSVSAEALEECGARGIHCIANGCPMMYVAPVDAGHACLRWVLKWLGRVPG